MSKYNTKGITNQLKNDQPNIKHWNFKIKQIDFWDMQSAAKLRRESNAAYQISSKPILDISEYAKKEVGGRGGAYK